MIILAIFRPTVVEPFFAEFLAGTFGIMLGFYLSREHEKVKKIKNLRIVLSSLLKELQYNLCLAKDFKREIVLPKRQIFSDSSPHGPGIAVFDLFQTNAWTLFSPKLELENVEVLYHLCTLYHCLELFNEAMRIESVGERRLSYLLRKDPKLLENIEKDLTVIINRLESL